MRTLLIAIAWSAAVAGAAPARTWQVPTDVPTIAAGLDSARTGDTVEVACGIYHEHGLTLGQGVTLRSATGDPACVAIDGDGLDSVVFCEFVDDQATLEGITLRHGQAQGLYPSGGGVLCRASRLLIRRCHFENNAAGWGGGLHAWNALVTVSDCTFTGNDAHVGGAAIDCTGGTPSFTGCEIFGNQGVATASAIRMAHAAAGFARCRIVGNALATGASVFVVVDSQLDLGDCVVGGTPGGGDGLFLQAVRAKGSGLAVVGAGGVGLRAEYGSVVDLVRATFAANAGGVVIGENTQASLAACLVAFNAGVGVFAAGGDVSVSCSDVYGNAGGDYGGDLPDQTGVAGNITADPRFCDLAADDIGLRAGSPALPEGNGCAVQMGAAGLACGATSVPGEALQTPFEARPNPFNPRVTLGFTLPDAGRVRLEILALDGTRVATLLDDVRAAGRHDMTWDGRDHRGRGAPAGVYIAHLATGGTVSSRRLTLVR